MRRVVLGSVLLGVLVSVGLAFAASLNVSSARLTAISNTLSEPSVAITLSNPGPVEVGTSVSADADLQSATSDAGGSVQYNVYSDSSCSSVYEAAGSSSVTNGNVDSSSSSVTFNSAGTFYWQAAYSGDGNNRPASSPCASGQLQVNAAPPSDERLYLSMSPFELVTDGATGSVLLSPGGGSAVWQSAGEVEVHSSNGWTLSIRQTGPSPFSTALIDVDVWVDDSGCGAPPASSASSYVAGTATPYDVVDKTVPETLTIALTGNPSFGQADAAYLCLAIANVDGNSGSPPHSIEISSGSASFLEGPVTP